MGKYNPGPSLAWAFFPGERGVFAWKGGVFATTPVYLFYASTLNIGIFQVILQYLAFLDKIMWVSVILLHKLNIFSIPNHNTLVKPSLLDYVVIFRINDFELNIDYWKTRRRR